MWKVDNIAFKCEFILKWERIVGLIVGRSFDFVILIVGDFHSFTNPPYFSLFKPAHWENIRFHAQIKKGMLFGEVHDIELDGHTLGDIPNVEEKPLVVSFCVDVVLKK